MIKGCIFDLDGTLMDTLEDLGNSTNIILEEYGYPVHNMSAYKTFVGNGIYKLIERALPEGSKDVEECYKKFNDVYKAHYLDTTDLYDGIKDMLQQLYKMNIKIAVVTNKPHYFAEQLCLKKIEIPLSCIYGEQVALYPKKPDPTSTHLALEKMGLKNDEVIFIGDSNVDIKTGINAHMLSIGVLWGFRSKKELLETGANYVVSKPEEIIEIINKINGGQK